MGNALYYIAIVLLVIWGIGFVGFNKGGAMHAVLVIAFIAIILRIIRGGS